VGSRSRNALLVRLCFSAAGISSLSLVPAPATAGVEVLWKVGPGPGTTDAATGAARPVIIAGVRDVVFVFDPASRQLAQFAIAPELTGPQGSRLILIPSRYTRRSAWDLSQSLKASPETAWGLAPVDENRAWLVDKTSRRLWYARNGEVSGPISLPDEEVQGATALSSGLLVVNTPRSEQSFALVGIESGVQTRFGAVARAPASPRAPDAWVLTTLPSDDIAAASTQSRALRIFSADGTLRSETLLRSALGREADADRDPDRGSLDVESRFVAAIAPHPVGVAISLADARRLEVFDRNGRAQQSFRLEGAEASSRSNRQPRGIVWFGDRILLADDTALSEFAPVSGRTGRVVDENGAGIPGATISLTEEASHWSLTSDSDGAFAIPVLKDLESGVAVARAQAFQDWRGRGALVSLLQVPIVLRRAAELCVSVLEEESGRPIQSFRIEVAQRRNAADSVTLQSGPRRAVEDPSGQTCEKPAIAGPPWLLRVTASGRAVTELEVQSLGWHTIRMPAEARARLVVRESATGAAVKRARAVLEDASLPERAFSAYSDEAAFQGTDEGVMDIRGLPEGTYRAHISADGFLGEKVLVALSTTGATQTVHLSRGARLRIHASSASSGLPVALADVQLFHSRMPASAAACRTAAAGDCQIENVPPARFDAVVSAPGLAPKRATVTVSAGEEAVSLDVSLDVGRPLRGHVSGLEQYPGYGFQIEASNPGLGRVRGALAPDGAFHFDSSLTGAAFVSLAEARSRVVFASAMVEEAQTDIEIRLPPPLVLTGRLSRDGAPCAACSLTVASTQWLGGSGAMAADIPQPGAYEIRLPLAGDYTVVITDRGSGLSMREPVTVTGSTVADFDLRTSSEIRGQVKRRDGAPAPRAWITCSESGGRFVAATANESGGFSCGGLPAGAYVVRASDGRLTGSATVVVGSEPVPEVAVTLQEAGSTRLRLVEQQGAPVQYSVTVRVASAKGTEYLLGKMADSAGVVELAVDPGPLEVAVQVRGFAVATWRGIPGDGEVPTLVFRPPAPVEFVGAIGDGCLLSVLGDQGPAPLGADLLNVARVFQGRLTTNLLAAGQYQADYRCPGAEATRTPFTLEPGIRKTVLLNNRP
jgi:hypothetical protein